eukprot:1173110-Rhodomonas_salina.2
MDISELNMDAIGQFETECASRSGSEAECASRSGSGAECSSPRSPRSPRSILRTASTDSKVEEVKRTSSFSRPVSALRRAFSRKCKRSATRVRFSKAHIWEYDSDSCEFPVGMVPE